MTQAQPLAQESPDVVAQEARSRHELDQQRGQKNVGDVERVISVAGGALLAMSGLSGLTALPGASRKIPSALLAVLGGGLIYRGVTGHCDMYAKLGIDTAHRGAPSPEEYFDRSIHVEQSFTINKTPWELYEYWRKLENLPTIMSHLESVRVIDEKRSHWVAKAPLGRTVEWDAEIINDEPNALIAWRSLDGADVDNAGSVRFVPAPGDRGTEVRVVLDYIPPAGKLGGFVAKLLGEDPQHEVREDLRAFKRLMETGEIPTIQGQPRGNCSGGGERHQGW
jgi:uncharacterized membrane protein